MSEPHWTVDTNEVAWGHGIMLMIIALPFIPPFYVGFKLGEHLSDLNGVRYVVGALFGLAWLGFLIYIYKTREFKGLIVVFIIEALLVDFFTSAGSGKAMFVVEQMQAVHTWFTMKIH